MSVEFTNQYIKGCIIDDVSIAHIYTITQKIKEVNYEDAFQIMNQNNFSFENIISKTRKLKNDELANFADYVIKRR